MTVQHVSLHHWRNNCAQPRNLHKLERKQHGGKMLLNCFNRDTLNYFILIEVCLVDILVACLRISTGFLRGFLQRNTSMRALLSDRQNCSHSVSQEFGRTRLSSDMIGNEKQPNSFFHKGFPNASGKHPNPGTSRPQSRDIPAIPCLKQLKKAPCIKLLSGHPRVKFRDTPASGSLMSQEYPPPTLYL